MLMYLYTMSIALVEVLLLLLVSATFIFSKNYGIRSKTLLLYVTSEEAGGQ